MNQSRNSALQWIVVAAVIIVLGGMTFLAGFGAGFGAGRVTAPKLAALGQPASAFLAPDETPAPAARPAVQGELPKEFDLVWEAWDALEEDYYGDLPETPEMVGGLVSGMLRAAEMETDDPLDREETATEVMSAVAGVIQERYGELPDAKMLTYGAINGVTFTLDDDYTFLRDPEEADFFTESLNGSFEGIGARVDEAEGGGVRIIEPFQDQPAWKAGIRRDDVILAVDGEDVTKMTLAEAIALIRGPKGSKVTLLIRTPGQEPREVEVERDRISIPAVEYKMLDNNVAYLRLGEFSGPSTDQLRSALDELLAQQPVGLVLDLRGNPGGYLHTAVDISSEFIDEGPILIERFKDGKEQVYQANSGGRALDIPLVVLVNEASASASEILAGAVQDSGRGILVGTTTYGKGSVQVPDELSDGSMLSVTTARWFTPKDRQINGQGLEPDIVVELTQDDEAAGKDPQLDRAVQVLLEKQQSKP